MKITTKNGVHYYDPGFRGDCRSESCEQIDAMGWIERNHPDRWPLVFHVPNETKATPQYMQRRQKEGVKPGVADIIDFGEVRGAFEMKRQDRGKSRLSKEQIAHLEAVAASGGFAAVCWGFEAFKAAYSEFLRGLKK